MVTRMTSRSRSGPASGPTRGYRRRSVGTVLGAALLSATVGCSGADGGDTTQTFDIPGETVFPEGIGVDKASGDFYVGSTSDGTIYRGNVDSDDVDVFLPGGQDGRDSATGVKVDDQGVVGQFD